MTPSKNKNTGFLAYMVDLRQEPNMPSSGLKGPNECVLVSFTTEREKSIQGMNALLLSSLG